jgi:hypothetical protein
MMANKSTTSATGDFLISGKKRVSHWRAFEATVTVGGDPALWEKDLLLGALPDCSRLPRLRHHLYQNGSCFR